MSRGRKPSGLERIRPPKMKPLDDLKRDMKVSRRRREGALTRAEERALVAAARDGDPKAMTRLLQVVSDPALRFGKGFCRDDHDAQEIMQDVLTSLVRSLSTFRGEAALTTWAYTVARNACLRRRRRRANAPLVLESLDAPDGEAARGALAVPDHDDDPARRFERRQLSELVERAIRALPTAQREVLVLRDVEGLSAGEVGRVLGIGERAVKSRLHRARVALRETLAPALGRRADGGARSESARVGRGRSCPDTAQLVSRYLEGELDASVCATLSKHVSACPNCGEVCETLRSALGVCRQYGEKPLPSLVRQQVRAAIRDAVSSWPGRERAVRE
jgi:RNA polymerase sigma-70 factor, ECF subfamily